MLYRRDTLPLDTEIDTFRAWEDEIARVPLAINRIPIGRDHRFSSPVPVDPARPKSVRRCLQLRRGPLDVDPTEFHWSSRKTRRTKDEAESTVRGIVRPDFQTSSFPVVSVFYEDKLGR